jgi:hypothetical protein
MRLLGLLLLAMGAVLIVTPPGRAEEIAGPHYEHLKPLEMIIGQWKMEGQWQDGAKIVGEESSEWFLNKNAIHSHGWFLNRAGQRVDFHIVTGWDPATRQIVQKFTDSDGTHSERRGRYDPVTKSLTGQHKGVSANGETFSYDVTLGLANPDEFTWKGTNVQGPEPLPDLEFTFKRVEPTEGERAFNSFMDLAVGGTWIRSDDVQMQHTYQWSVGSKFVQHTAKGGSRPFVTMIGVDPRSKQCTWWFYNEDGSVGMATLEQTGDGVWILEEASEGLLGPTRYKGVISRLHDDTIKEEIRESVINGEPQPTGSFLWKRSR